MTHSQRRKAEVRQYKRILFATMPLFFVAVLINRALPWNWGRDDRSLFAATRSAANSTIPFAFM